MRLRPSLAAVLFATMMGCQPALTITGTALPASSPDAAASGAAAQATAAANVSDAYVTIAGEIRDQDNELLPHVDLMLDSLEEFRVLHMEVRSEDGRYRFEGVPAGLKVKITLKVDEHHSQVLDGVVPAAADAIARAFSFAGDFAVPREDARRKRLAASPTPSPSASPSPSPRPTGTSSPTPTATATPYTPPSTNTSSGSNCHYVSGYYRKNGTYVKGYTRCL